MFSKREVNKNMSEAIMKTKKQLERELKKAEWVLLCREIKMHNIQVKVQDLRKQMRKFIKNE